MAANGQPAKKTKVDKIAGPDASNEDEACEQALVDLDNCQNQIDSLNEKASEEILRVEQKYNKLRKPLYDKRNAIVEKIPNFWVTVFQNHPAITLTEDEEACLHYMSKLEVEEFEDIKSGFKISFHFDENPYFENNLLVKEFNLDTEDGEMSCKNTEIKWKKDYENLLSQLQKGAGRKRKHGDGDKTFFLWYCATETELNEDNFSEVIKDDIWHNPLQYYLLSGDDDQDEDEGEMEEEQDNVDDEEVILDEGGDDDDDVIVEEEEDEDEDN